jgi:hypothetical protein
MDTEVLPPLDMKITDPKPRIGRDLQKLICLMRGAAWANLILGFISMGLYMVGISTNESVITTGFMSVCMYGLVRAKISYINGSKSWIEVSVTTACGLYLPVFTFLMTLLTLLGVFRAV